MPSTRRRFLTRGSLVVTLLSGCAGLRTTTPDIAEMEVELVNAMDDAHVFHFAVETTDGLGEWRSHEVAPNTSEVVRWEPDETFDPVEIHGVVADQTARGEVFDIEGAERSEICLHIVFEYGVGDEPTFLMSSDIRC